MPVAKAELLYLSPVIPALTGNGLAMRAGMVLEALARHYTVTLLVVTRYPPYEDRVPDRFEKLCRRATVVPLFGMTARTSVRLWRPWRHRPVVPGPDELWKEFGNLQFDVIHVFRLAMVPFARPFIDSPGQRRRHLDLDDLESLTHARLADLCRMNGDTELASREDAEADRCRALERRALKEFDRVYVCSPEDRQKLSAAAGSAEICVLPNGVRVPKPPRGPGSQSPFSFLFVGTLGYYPNADAVRYLCAEIVPRIRRNTSRDFEICIIGPGASARLSETVKQARLIMVGEVPDMRPWYERSAAVLVPIRAGGGTRIKILEAWSYRRPVVSTTVGIEGIHALDQEHALIADTPDSFAERCARLIEDPQLSRHLAENGHSLVLRSFTPESIETAIAALDGSTR